MLVVISDLHLNDATTGTTLEPAALALFAERLKELAFSASWRSDGYRPVERIDLLLLGDVLDLIRSARWAALPGVRPWGNPHAPEFVEQIARITQDILAQNEQVLAILRGLTEGEIRLPPSLRSARPAVDAEAQPVTVRLHYMVGDHDWFYHLPGPKYDAVRQALVEQLGLAARADHPLPHDAAESDELFQVLRRHKVAARHGDLFDPLSFEGDRDASGPNDAVAIDLVSRFATAVESTFGGELPDCTLHGLREIHNIHPPVLVPVWLERLLERTCPMPATRKRIKTLWDRLADELLAGEFLRRRGSEGPPNLVEGLKRALKFKGQRSVGPTDAILAWLETLRGAPCGSYHCHALAEADFRNRRAKHVVYGHTHLSEQVPLDASYAEGYVLDQVYFNAGAWCRVYSPTRFAPSPQEFIARDALGYLAFFQGDERKGRPYETWCGTLGYRGAQTRVYRGDPGGSSPSAQGPHFLAIPANTIRLSAYRRP
ncbi:MAG: hypothetical protein ABSG68_05775 [Thermoguttaceae bacterium]|jgi:hypothetical protein